jgi:hypothetical protein
MAISASKTFVAGEILTASDLNAEFTHIYSNGEDLAWPATKAKAFNGQELTLDSDANTSMYSTTGDQVDWNVGAVNLFTFDGTTADSVSGFTFVTAATGAPSTVDIQARSAVDADININLVPKGTGTVQIGGVELLTIASDLYRATEYL